MLADVKCHCKMTSVMALRRCNIFLTLQIHVKHAKQSKYCRISSVKWRKVEQCKIVMILFGSLYIFYLLSSIEKILLELPTLYLEANRVGPDQTALKVQSNLG